MPTRQKLGQLEQIPKAVHKAPSWRDPGRLLANEALAARVTHVIRCIENGKPLPSGYYRKGLGLNSDELLEVHGIMHLHLGKSNTSELLYLVQYPDHVVLLELSDHAHFALRPIGTRLNAVHERSVAALEHELLARPIKPKRPLMRQRPRAPRRPASDPPE